MGTRHDTLGFANAYWWTRQSKVIKDPFVVYTFDTGKDAREALLELPCIYVAEDSQKLICTEMLIFGYYPTKSEKYEAVICGDELTHELWEQAKASFSKYGGSRKNELEPERDSTSTSKAKKAKRSKVVFVRVIASKGMER